MFGRPQPTKHDLVRLVSMAWAGFVEPMNFASSFTSLRDQEDVGGNEDVETLPDWASRQWTGAISPEFCQESFENIGMFPLSPISKRQRTFVEGGVLMTRDEMIASVLKAEEARREKAAAKSQQLEKKAAQGRLAAEKKAAKAAKAHKKSLLSTKQLKKTSLSTDNNDVAETEKTSEPIRVNLYNRDAQSLLLLASAAGFDVAM
ncbi:hypothetical protein GN958_ATG06656 [Phytophthora infestans]|uniref:Uncharacterized protein n=1 Tax=Phytophthora infestans TaxID=4787 RepID=A0A8S9UT72_PHYIN|nr:hypothetical protein GN958_ATG06656 [Phytophthora infestans]